MTQRAEADKQMLFAAIQDYRRGAQTAEVLIVLARRLYATEDKTVRAYVRHQRQSRTSLYGFTVQDRDSLRDVVISVGDDR
jgi:uncharacterized protein YbgA (DUF1722 family)